MSMVDQLPVGAGLSQRLRGRVALVTGAGVGIEQAASSSFMTGAILDINGDRLLR
jgi:hypothetical protein